MRKFALTSFILAILLTVSGCVSVPQGANRLLKAPKEDATAKSVVTALESEIKGDYTVKSPRAGKYKSACTFRDIDADGISEALLFYSKSKGNVTSLYLSVFENTDSVWKIAGTVKFGGTDVEEIDFCTDAKGDAVKLCVEWYVYSDIETRISVIDFDNLKPKSVLEESCRKYAVYDIDKNGSDDVLVLGTNTLKNESYCNMYSFENGSLTKPFCVKIDGHIGKINALRKTEIDNNSALIAEITDKEGTFYCEILVFKNGKLSAPVFEQSGQSNLITRHYQNVKCRDVTENGSLEIPCMTVLPKGDNNTDDMFLTEWKNYKNNKFVTVQYSVFSPSTQYGINIDTKWIGKFTCLKDGDDGMIFYEYSPDGIKNEIFRVCPVVEEDFKGDEYKDYFSVYKKNGIVYSAKVAQNQTSRISADESKIKELFFYNAEGAQE